MKTLTKLLTVLAILGLSQSVFGVSYLYETATYVDQQFWLVAPQMNDATQTISGTLDISEDGVEAEDWDKVGYNPNSETITLLKYYLRLIVILSIFSLGVRMLVPQISRMEI